MLSDVSIWECFLAGVKKKFTFLHFFLITEKKQTCPVEYFPISERFGACRLCTPRTLVQRLSLNGPCTAEPIWCGLFVRVITINPTSPCFLLQQHLPRTLWDTERDVTLLEKSAFFSEANPFKELKMLSLFFIRCNFILPIKNDLSALLNP